MSRARWYSGNALSAWADGTGLGRFGPFQGAAAQGQPSSGAQGQSLTGGSSSSAACACVPLLCLRGFELQPYCRHVPCVAGSHLHIINEYYKYLSQATQCTQVYCRCTAGVPQVYYTGYTGVLQLYCTGYTGVPQVYCRCTTQATQCTACVLQVARACFPLLVVQDGQVGAALRHIGVVGAQGGLALLQLCLKGSRVVCRAVWGCFLYSAHKAGCAAAGDDARWAAAGS